MFSSKRYFDLPKVFLICLILLLPAPEIRLTVSFGKQLNFSSGAFAESHNDNTGAVTSPVIIFNPSKAEGDAAKAEDDAAKAEDDAAKAEDDAAKAEGDAAKAEGDAAKAEGDAAKAEGDAAKAEDAAEKDDSDGVMETILIYLLSLLILFLLAFLIWISWSSLRGKFKTLRKKNHRGNLVGNLLNQSNEKVSLQEEAILASLTKENTFLKTENADLLAKVKVIDIKYNKINTKYKEAETNNKNLLNKIRSTFDNESVSSLGVEVSLLSIQKGVIQKGNRNGEGLVNLIRFAQEIDMNLFDSAKHTSVVVQQLEEFGEELFHFLSEIGYSQNEVSSAVDDLVSEISDKSKFRFDFDVPIAGTNVDSTSMKIKGGGDKVTKVINWGILYDNEIVTKAVVNS